MSLKSRSFFGERSSNATKVRAREEDAVPEAQQHEQEGERVGRENGSSGSGVLSPRERQDDVTMSAQKYGFSGGRGQGEEDAGRENDAIGGGEQEGRGLQEEDDEEDDEDEEEGWGPQGEEGGFPGLKVRVDPAPAPPSPEADATGPTPPEGETATTATPTASVDALQSNSQPNTSDRRRPPSSISSGFSSSSDSSQGSCGAIACTFIFKTF